jgi:hypothetical protein
MQLELTIHGSPVEIQQVLDAIKSTDASDEPEPLNKQGFDTFRQKITFKGRKVFEAILHSSNDDKTGITEEELEERLGENPTGAIGGLAKAWSSVFGDEYGQPFRKQGTGAKGLYRLPRDIADDLVDVLYSENADRYT